MWVVGVGQDFACGAGSTENGVMARAISPRAVRDIVDLRGLIAGKLLS
jgi:hypothetical protein